MIGWIVEKDEQVWFGRTEVAQVAPRWTTRASVMSRAKLPAARGRRPSATVAWWTGRAGRPREAAWKRSGQSDRPRPSPVATFSPRPRLSLGGAPVSCRKHVVERRPAQPEIAHRDFPPCGAPRPHPRSSSSPSRGCRKCQLREPASPGSGSPQPIPGKRGPSLVALGGAHPARPPGICPPTRSLSSLPRCPERSSRPWSITANLARRADLPPRGYWVGEQKRRPPRGRARRTTDQILIAAARIPARSVGSSQEQQRAGRVRRVDCEVEDGPPHPTGVRARAQAIGGVSQVEAVEQLVGPSASIPRPRGRTGAPNIWRFSRPVSISSTAANWPVSPNSSPHRPAASVDPRSAAKYLGPSGVRSEPAWPSTRTRVVLPPRRSVPNRPKNRGLLHTSRSTPASAVVVRKRLTTTLDVDSRIRHHSPSEMMRLDRGNLRDHWVRALQSVALSARARRGISRAGRPTQKRRGRSPSSSSAVF